MITLLFFCWIELNNWNWCIADPFPCTHTWREVGKERETCCCGFFTRICNQQDPVVAETSSWEEVSLVFPFFFVLLISGLPGRVWSPSCHKRFLLRTGLHLIYVCCYFQVSSIGFKFSRLPVQVPDTVPVQMLHQSKYLGSIYMHCLLRCFLKLFNLRTCSLLERLAEEARSSTTSRFQPNQHDDL